MMPTPSRSGTSTVGSLSAKWRRNSALRSISSVAQVSRGRQTRERPYPARRTDFEFGSTDGADLVDGAPDVLERVPAQTALPREVHRRDRVLSSLTALASERRERLRAPPPPHLLRGALGVSEHDPEHRGLHSARVERPNVRRLRFDASCSSPSDPIRAGRRATDGCRASGREEQPAHRPARRSRRGRPRAPETNGAPSREPCGPPRQGSDQHHRPSRPSSRLLCPSAQFDADASHCVAGTPDARRARLRSRPLAGGQNEHRLSPPRSSRTTPGSVALRPSTARRS